jgi:DNA-binding SARP family transcriptional activator
LKRADGTDVDDGFKDFVRAQRKNFKLSPAATTKLAEELSSTTRAAAASKTADETAEATKAMEQLRQSWGPNYEANKVIADNAYAAMMAAAGFDQPR